MKIKINGKEFEFDMATTLSQAMEKAAVKQGGVATALNGKVIPAAMRGKTILADGDNIVIIKAFYGG